MKSGVTQIYPDERDRLGEKLRQAGNARENQWAAERDRELLAEMRRKRSERQMPRKVAQVSPAFTRILCPTDFGESSLQALDLARALTAYHDATLYVLHVSRRDADQLQETPEGGAPGMNTASARLDELVARRLGDVRHRCFVAVGKPADKIAEVSLGIGADLIVIGTPARSTLSRLLLGSVTKRVLEKSACPVLVALCNAGAILEVVTMQPGSERQTRRGDTDV